MDHYLITGATGVVGGALVRKLAARGDRRLELLVRGRDEAEARSRVRRLLRELDVDTAAAEGRVVCVRGDVEAPGLGLAGHDHERLCASVTHIVHCAASVRMNLPLEDARRAAVAATGNILDLAEACRRRGALRKVEVVSTVGVGGRWTGPLPERWLDEERRFHNTYEQAKAEAETLVRARIDQGLPATVHRPSMVVGDSTTGQVAHFQVFYHLAEFLSGRRTFGLLPPLGGRTVDLVPADHVAEAIAWSSSTQATCGGVLHLCAGEDDAVPLDLLRSVVRRAFGERGLPLPALRTLPAPAFRRLAAMAAPIAPPAARRALAALPIFLDYLGETQVFSNRATRALLAGAGIAAPKPDRFLGPVLGYYLDRTYGRRGNPG